MTLTYPQSLAGTTLCTWAVLHNSAHTNYRFFYLFMQYLSVVYQALPLLILMGTRSSIIMHVQGESLGIRLGYYTSWMCNKDSSPRSYSYTAWEPIVVLVSLDFIFQFRTTTRTTTVVVPIGTVLVASSPCTLAKCFYVHVHVEISHSNNVVSSITTRLQYWRTWPKFWGWGDENEWNVGQ